MAQVFVKSKVASQIFEGIEQRLKAMPIAELEKIGLTLKPGAVLKRIADNDIAANRLIGVVSRDSLLSMSKLSVPDLINYYSEFKDVAKPKAKEAIMELLGDCVEEKQNAPSLAVLK